MARHSPYRPIQAPALPEESKTSHLGPLYSGTPANEVLNPTQPDSDTLDQACLALLASRVFSQLLPDNSIDAETMRASERVANALSLQAEDAKYLKGSARMLVERLAYASRGKRLHQHGTDLTHRLSLVMRAVLTGHCLTGQFNLRTRELQPYGLVVRELEIYLLAVETPEHPEASDQSNTPVIKQYLLNRFESLDISTTPSNVPEDFNVKAYIDNDCMDVNIPELEQRLGPQFQLVLRVCEQNNDALIRDLQDFSLDNQQQAVIKADEENNYHLTVPNQAPTYALCEWLLGRTDRVEVLEPAELRQYMIDRLRATYRRYKGDDAILSDTTLSAEETAYWEDLHDRVEQIDLEESGDPTPAPRTNYASNNKKNRLVVCLVLRILSEMRIDKELLNKNETWHIDPLFDGDIRAFVNEEDVDGFRAWVKAQNDAIESEDPDYSDPLLVNVRDSGALLSLLDVETDLLCLAALVHICAPLRSALSLMNEHPTEQDAYQIIWLLTQQSVEDIAAALQDTSTLRSAGLIGRRPISIDSVQDVLKMPDSIATNLFANHERLLGLLSGLVQSSPEPRIGQGDLEHLADPLSVAEDYLKGASKRKAKGCNVLLWGPPGTGKTQVARYLGSKLSLNPWEVLSAANSGKAMRELERVSSYRLIQTLLEGPHDSLVIFDEVQNILDSSYSVREEISKASLKELLESNEVPAIWISNSVQDVDPEYLRHFDVVIEVPVPDFAAKKRLAQRILNDIPLNGELLDAFLERREVGSSFLKKIRRVSILSGASTEQAVGALATKLLHSEIAVSGSTPAVLPGSDDNPHQSTTLPYDVSLINASEDLGALASTLVSGMNIKFFFYGPPGTGKTAWARKLATQLDKSAHVIQTSDIRDKYTEESEKDIAKAFAMAEKEEAILIFDEVDSFLQNRGGPSAEHTLSNTDQYLTSLENYKGLVVCSTNLIDEDDIDTAALKHFDFTVKFNYLTAAQANQLLVTTAGLLGMDITVKDVIAHNCGLRGDSYAPGDFAAVLKKSQIRSGETMLEQLCADVMAEAEIRNANNIEQ